MTAATKTKADIFLASCILYSFTTVLTLMYAMSDDVPKNWMTFVIEVALFPFVFAASYFEVTNTYLLWFIAMINMLLYAFLFVKLFSPKLSNHRKYKPFTLCFIVGCTIPAIVIVWAGYLIFNS